MIGIPTTSWVALAIDSRGYGFLLNSLDQVLVGVPSENGLQSPLNQLPRRKQRGMAAVQLLPRCFQTKRKHETRPKGLGIDPKGLKYFICKDRYASFNISDSLSI